ncbi:MAG: hypothetical protein ACHP7P_13240 [Terriglobales bacterium]
MWLSFIALACFYCFRHEWFIGLALIAMTVLVGMVAASLHGGKTAAELAAGYPTRGEAFASDSGELSHEDSVAIAKALLRLRWILGIAAVILAAHYGMKIYFAILLGLLVALAGAAGIGIAFSLLAGATRQRSS